MTKKNLLTFTELLLLTILLAFFFLRDIGKVEFHIDEAHWIATSDQFEPFIRLQYNADIWHESHTTLTNPPVPRYFIALGRLAGGYHVNDLPSIWDYSKNINFNKRVGSMPSDDLLWWSRLPMAFLAIFSLMIIYVLLRKLAGIPAALIWIILNLANPYIMLTLRRAMAESSLIFLIFLGIWLCIEGANAYHQNHAKGRILFLLSGVSIGLAGSCKMNGLGVLLGVAFTILLLSWKEYPTLKQKIGVAFSASAIVVIISMFAFWASYPYFWPNPIGRTLKMLNNRVSEMTYQTGTHSPDSIETFAQRINIIPLRIWQDFAPIRFNGSIVLNLLLTLVGIAILANFSLAWWRGTSKNSTAFVLLAVGFFASVPSFFTMLDWDRYYLLPVIFSTIAISIAIGLSINHAYKVIRPNHN